MFIKIVQYPRDRKESVNERVIECSEYHQGYSEDGKEASFMVYDSIGVQREVVVECEYSKVYIVSAAGKTIDSYHWRNVEGVVKRV